MCPAHMPVEISGAPVKQRSTSDTLSSTSIMPNKLVVLTLQQLKTVLQAFNLKIEKVHIYLLPLSTLSRSHAASFYISHPCPSSIGFFLRTEHSIITSRQVSSLTVSDWMSSGEGVVCVCVCVHGFVAAVKS
ncbi:hypothetical protein INR49_005147, partial [Caranx melampygus]